MQQVGCNCCQLTSELFAQPDFRLTRGGRSSRKTPCQNRDGVPLRAGCLTDSQSSSKRWDPVPLGRVVCRNAGVDPGLGRPTQHARQVRMGGSIASTVAIVGLGFFRTPATPLQLTWQNSRLVSESSQAQIPQKALLALGARRSSHGTLACQRALSHGPQS